MSTSHRQGIQLSQDERTRLRSLIAAMRLEADTLAAAASSGTSEKTPSPVYCSCSDGSVSEHDSDEDDDGDGETVLDAFPSPPTLHPRRQVCSLDSDYAMPPLPALPLPPQRATRSHARARSSALLSFAQTYQVASPRHEHTADGRSGLAIKGVEPLLSQQSGPPQPSPADKRVSVLDYDTAMRELLSADHDRSCADTPDEASAAACEEDAGSIADAGAATSGSASETDDIYDSFLPQRRLDSYCSTSSGGTRQSSLSLDLMHDYTDSPATTIDSRSDVRSDIDKAEASKHASSRSSSSSFDGDLSIAAVLARPLTRRFSLVRLKRKASPQKSESPTPSRIPRTKTYARQETAFAAPMMIF